MSDKPPRRKRRGGRTRTHTQVPGHSDPRNVICARFGISLHHPARLDSTRFSSVVRRGPRTRQGQRRDEGPV